MTWEPTPEQVERVANAVSAVALTTSPHLEEVARTALDAFVPEGTVPVFLTREDAELRLEALRPYKHVFTPRENREWIALDAALKEMGE